MADTIQTGIQIDVNSDLEGLEQAQEGLENLNQASQETQEQLNQLGESAENAQNGLENIAGAEAGEALDNLGSNAENAEERIRQLLEEIMRIAEEAENAGQGLGNLSNSANRAGDGLNNAGRNAEGSLKIFDNLKKKVAELGTAMAALYSARNIAGFFGSATSQAADFENQMRRIQAVMGSNATAEALEAIEKKAKELGASTRFTTTEAAQGFEVLARAGLNTAEQLQTISEVLATAQGNSIGIAEAADIVITSISQMRLATADAGRVADVLTMSAQSANESIQDLGEGFKYVAPTAADAGMSIEQVSAWLSVLNQNGLKAGMAGTALRKILLDFSNPASNFRNELAALGITTDNFEEAIKQLSQSTQDTGKAFISVGDEATGALRILASENGLGFFSKMSESLAEAEGAAKKAAQTMDSSLQGAVAGLGSAWEGLKLELGKPMLDPLREQVSGLSQSIRDLTQGGGVKAFGESLANVFSLIAKSVGTVAKYSAQIVAIGGAYATAKVSLTAYNAVITAYQSRVAIATAAQSKLNTVLTAFKSPLGLITTAIAGAVLAYQALKSKVEEVVKTHEEARNAFEPVKRDLEELKKINEGLIKVDNERLEAIKTNLTAYLSASEQQVKAYKDQQEAAKEKLVFDKEAWAAASQGIEIELRNQANIQKTLNAQNELAKAQQKATEELEKANQAKEEAKKGWDTLNFGLDQHGRALLEIPPKSEKVLKALASISKDASQTGADLKRAFELGAGEIETEEAKTRLTTMFNQLRADARLTKEEYDTAFEVIKEKTANLPPKVNEATVALNALGLSAQQVQTGISKEAGEAVKLFSLASKNFIADAEKMGTVYNAALTKMDSPQAVEALNQALRNVVNGNNEFVLATQRSAEAQRNAKNAVEQQQQALSALGISLTAANQGMSQSGLEMANNLRIGLSAIQENITGAENLKIAFESAFNNALNAAQTTADFQQLQTVLNEAGFTAQMTKEQMGMLTAGINGGADAVQLYKNSLEQLKTATEQQQMALDALGISIEAANQGMSKAGFEMANNFELAVQAMQKGITNADAFGNSLNSAFEKALNSAQTTADFQALSESLTKTGAAAQMSSDAMAVLQAGMQGGAEAAKKMRAELTALATAQAQAAQSQSDNAKTGEEATKKQAEAQKKLREESQRTARAINQVKAPDLGNSGAEKLTNDMQKAKKAIDNSAESVKRMQENFKNLTASARDSADSIAQQLASLRGEEESVLEMQNAQKLRQLQEKLNDAKARGNAEEVKQYQRAISLQRELYSEQQKQLEDKKAKEAESSASVNTANTAKLPNASQSKTANAGTGGISAEEVANAFSAQIEKAKQEAMNEGARLGKEQLAKELIAAAKSRRR